MAVVCKMICGRREFTASGFEALPRKAAARYLSLMPAGAKCVLCFFTKESVLEKIRTAIRRPIEDVRDVERLMNARRDIAAGGTTSVINTPHKRFVQACFARHGYIGTGRGVYKRVSVERGTKSLYIGGL